MPFDPNRAASPQTASERAACRGRLWGLIPGFAAALYPLLLGQFHQAVAPAGAAASFVLAAVWLALAFSVPALGFVFALTLSAPEAGARPQLGPARRLAYLSVAAPTLFTFMGVLTYMAKAPVSDARIWAAAWFALVVWAGLADPAKRAAHDRPDLPRWRVAHGISGAILALFVLFHLTNHLFGLIGPQAHEAVMKLGRTVYRSHFVEPLLVTVFLFQVVTGLRLAWRWMGGAADGFRVFQLASGGYLSLYILGHMNSVFVFSRTFLKSDTGWNFATGAPTGLIHDAWNIRLVPHYWLGVFLVLGHLLSGLRIVLLAHGVARPVADRLFFAGLALAFVLATAILLGMGGLRL